MTPKALIPFIFLLSPVLNLSAQVSISPFYDGIHHWNLEHANRNYRRYNKSDFTKIAENLLAPVLSDMS